MYSRAPINAILCRYLPCTPCDDLTPAHLHAQRPLRAPPGDVVHVGSSVDCADLPVVICAWSERAFGVHVQSVHSVSTFTMPQTNADADADSDAESVDTKQERKRKQQRRGYNKNRDVKRKRVRLTRPQVKHSRKALAKRHCIIGGPENHVLAAVYWQYSSWLRRNNGSLQQKRRDRWFRRVAQQLETKKLAYESAESLKKRFQMWKHSAARQVRREKKKKKKKKKKKSMNTSK